MFTKSSTLIVTALVASTALIGFAFYVRNGGSVIVPDVAFYLAAAAIAVAPVLLTLPSHRRRKAANKA